MCVVGGPFLWAQSNPAASSSSDPVELAEIELHLVKHDRDGIVDLLKQRGLSDLVLAGYPEALLPDLGATAVTLRVVQAARVVHSTQNSSTALRFLNEETEIRTLLLQDPHNGRLHQVLGCLFLREGKSFDGLSESREAVTLQPNSTSAHFQLGLALLEQKNRQQGVAELRAAARLRPDLFVFHRVLAQSALQSGDLKEAENEFLQDATRGIPGRYDPYPREMLADIYLKKGDFDSAIKQYKDILFMHPNDLAAKQGLDEALKHSTLLRAGGASSKSRTAGQVSDEQGNQTQTRVGTSRSAFNAPPPGASPQQKTTTQTRKGPQLSPEEKEAQKHYLLAQEALKNEDLDTASYELKIASIAAPKNALVWYDLAIVESKKGNVSTAFDNLRKAKTLGLSVHEKSKAERLEADLQNRLQADPAQAPGNRAAEGEAKQPADIFEWLTTNAGVGLAFSYVIDDNGQTFVKISNSVAQVGSPCTLQIATIVNMTHFPTGSQPASNAWSTESTKSTTFRMGDLVPDSIVASFEGRYFGLRLHTAGGRETIDISETFHGVTGTSSSSQKHSNQFDLIAADQQYAERFKHAIDDLIKSCGGSSPKVTY